MRMDYEQNDVRVRDWNPSLFLHHKTSLFTKILRFEARSINFDGLLFLQFNATMFEIRSAVNYVIIIHVRTILVMITNVWPPLWSSGQSLWLQIQRSRVRFPALPDLVVVGLERGPLSLVRSIEELLE